MIDNTQATFWDKMYNEGRDYTVIEEGFLDDFIAGEKIPTGNALDIGCGTGDLAVKLSRKGFAVLGIDISPVAIAKATERAVREKSNAQFLVGDVFTLDTSAVYDVVFCKLVYAFIKEKKEFLEEISKHLKVGGVLVVITPILNDSNKDLEQKPGICSKQSDIEKIFEVFPATKEYKTDLFPEGRIITTFLSKKER